MSSDFFSFKWKGMYSCQEQIKMAQRNKQKYYTCGQKKEKHIPSTKETNKTNDLKITWKLLFPPKRNTHIHTHTFFSLLITTIINAQCKKLGKYRKKHNWKTIIVFCCVIFQYFFMTSHLYISSRIYTNAMSKLSKANHSISQ